METVKPPVNGKKLWRVKKAQHRSSQPEANTVQCLQNSLRITAAGGSYTCKKPQMMKRPRNKPGMPKDFVFVDLSPVKGAEQDDKHNTNVDLLEDLSLPPSPTMSDNSENSDSNDSLITNDTSITDISYDQMLDQADFTNDEQISFDFGLGLLNFDGKFLFDQDTYQPQLQQPFPVQQAPVQQSPVQQSPVQQQQLPAQQPVAQVQTPIQQFQPKFETPVNQITRTPQTIHKRSKSVDGIKKKPLQFKTYSPKPKSNKVRKPQLTHRHTVSEPVNKEGLDDFMSLNNQITVSLNNQNSQIVDTPESDDELLHLELNQPLSSDFNCGVDQFLTQKQEEFDFNAFVSI